MKFAPTPRANLAGEIVRDFYPPAYRVNPAGQERGGTDIVEQFDILFLT